MKIKPLTYFLLVRMHDVGEQSKLHLPEGATITPYGEVIATGPDCKNIKVGDKILFLPENFISGFDKGGDERFVIPESAVFGLIDTEEDQDGTPTIQ